LWLGVRARRCCAAAALLPLCVLMRPTTQMAGRAPGNAEVLFNISAGMTGAARKLVEMNAALVENKSDGRMRLPRGHAYLHYNMLEIGEGGEEDTHSPKKFTASIVTITPIHQQPARAVKDAVGGVLAKVMFRDCKDGTALLHIFAKDNVMCVVDVSGNEDWHLVRGANGESSAELMFSVDVPLPALRPVAPAAPVGDPC